MSQRKKISTTISPESYAFLSSLIRSKRASTLAEAVDLVLERAREEEYRERLERATAAYFDNLSPEQAAEENALGEAVARAAGEINLDE
jgi:hypothetical protein